MKRACSSKLTVFLILTLALLTPPYDFPKAGENAKAQKTLDLRGEIPRLSIWKGQTIKYSSDISKLVYSNSIEERRRLNRDSLNNFPAKVMCFNFDKQDYEIYEGQRSPKIDNDLEPVGL